MRLLVLGQLSVEGPGGPVELRSSKLNSILAALLLRVGQTASPQYLERAVWDLDAPDGSRAALHSSILRLRRLFAEHGLPSDVIVTTPHGYRLPAGSEVLDLVTFRAAVTEAEQATCPIERRDALRRALAQWQTPPTSAAPLLNVPSEHLRRDVIPMLIEEWAQAAERCYAAELQLGNARGIIGELRAATSGFPTHEGFSAQLAEALCLAERQHEALAEIRRIRALLREDLGLAPGEPLRQLEVDILRGELPDRAPILSLVPTVTTRESSLDTDCPAVRRLRDRSRGHSTLTGRAVELSALTRVLGEFSAAGGIVSVTGAPGVGKSALAAAATSAWAHDTGRATSFRCDCHSPSALPDDAGAGEGGLLVVENAGPLAAEQYAAAAESGAAVLLISRYSQMTTPLGTSAWELRLGPLSDVAGGALAAALGGTAGLATDDGLCRLARLCGGFPGAIALAAARLRLSRDRDLDSFIGWLEQDPVRRLSMSRDPRTSLGLAFEEHLATIHPASSAAFYTLAGHTSDTFDVSTAATVLGTSEFEAEIALEELVAACLLDVDSCGIYAVLALPRAVAVSRARGPARQPETKSLIPTADRRRA